ncbi:hypothetical protein ACU4GH_34170 [Bradyrhizobium betae]
MRGLWLNTGHGTLGWTTACGSGKLLSDLVSGRSPAIRSDDLSVYTLPGRHADARNQARVGLDRLRHA